MFFWSSTVPFVVWTKLLGDPAKHLQRVNDDFSSLFCCPLVTAAFLSFILSVCLCLIPFSSYVLRNILISSEKSLSVSLLSMSPSLSLSLLHSLYHFFHSDSLLWVYFYTFHLFRSVSLSLPHCMHLTLWGWMYTYTVILRRRRRSDTSLVGI